VSPASCRSPRRAVLGLLLGLLLGLPLVAACDGDPAERPRRFGGDRPVTLQVPPQLDDGRDYPLVLILHGYGANGFLQQAYFGAGELATRGDAFVLAPEGTVDGSGKQFWNADPVCCDFGQIGPDDVGYLGGLVDDVLERWPIDPAAVFILGHSNGGFMAYRLACERADRFAAILALAGVTVSLPCEPARLVSVLHVHGTADDVVPYAGATHSITEWAGLDGCGGAAARGPDLDLDTGLPGAETRAEALGGCPAGVAVDLWTIEGGGHLPSFGPAFAPAAWQWLTEHRR
jgi:polyhydroxybutyrate depolymerase